MTSTATTIGHFTKVPTHHQLKKALRAAKPKPPEKLSEQAFRRLKLQIANTVIEGVKANKTHVTVTNVSAALADPANSPQIVQLHEWLTKSGVKTPQLTSGVDANGQKTVTLVFDLT